MKKLYIFKSILIILLIFTFTSCIKKIKSDSASSRILNSEASVDKLFNELKD